MQEFKTINKNAQAEITEKKSKFISNIFYIETVEQAEEYIKQIKKKYYDAKHHVFAYGIETSDGGLAIKYNDDGEPQGTAGAPILKIITEQGLSNVLIIVTRYFGGILLGTGGLVHAYSEASKKVLKQVEYINKVLGYEIKVELEYGELDKLKYYTNKNNIKILDIIYSEKIEVIIEVTKQELEKITNNNSKLEVKILKYDILKEKNIDI